jgi:hypothetical protein
MNFDAISFPQGGAGMVRVLLAMAILVCGSSASVIAAGDELATRGIGGKETCCGPVFIHYVPALTTMVNDSIPRGGNFVRFIVAKLRLSARSADTLFVEYTEGASADPGFIISLIEEDGPRRLGPPIFGLDFDAPGDGFFYVRGHTNSLFDMRRRFTVEGGNLREVKQPFYYVGLETKTLDRIKIFSDQSCSEVMDSLPKGAPVTVVLSDKWTFLLRFDHDILGWWTPKRPWQSAEEIEGIYLKGD